MKFVRLHEKQDSKAARQIEFYWTDGFRGWVQTMKVVGATYRVFGESENRILLVSLSGPAYKWLHDEGVSIYAGDCLHEPDLEVYGGRAVKLLGHTELISDYNLSDDSAGVMSHDYLFVVKRS